MSQPAPASNSLNLSAPRPFTTDGAFDAVHRGPAVAPGAAVWAGSAAGAMAAWHESWWFGLLRWAWLALAVVATMLAAGCATPKQIKPDAVSFGSWPAERAPGTFAFERLPSQEQQGERRDKLEAAASAALQRAGFKRAESAESADVLVQAAAHYIRGGPIDYNWGPYWYGVPRAYLMSGAGTGYGLSYAHYRGGPYFRGYGYWGYRSWGPMPTQILEASLVLRDRKTQKIIYEARARYDFPWNNDPSLVEALFDAALKDFPTPKSRRTVTVPLPPRHGDEADEPQDPPAAAGAPAKPASAAEAAKLPAPVPAASAPAASAP